MIFLFYFAQIMTALQLCCHFHCNHQFCILFYLFYFVLLFCTNNYYPFSYGVISTTNNINLFFSLAQITTIPQLWCHFHSKYILFYLCFYTNWCHFHHNQPFLFFYFFAQIMNIPKVLVPPQSTIFIYIYLFIFVVVLHKLQLSLSYGVISTAINNFANNKVL